MDLAEIEQNTYRAAVDHGIWDIVVGFFLFMMGLTIAVKLAYLMGVVPVLAAPIWKSLHASVLEPRMGYVQLSAARKRQIRRGMCIALSTMIPLIVVPILIGKFMDRDLGRIPGVPALLTGLLLGVPVLVAGYLLEWKRMFLYAGFIGVAMATGYWFQIRYDAVIAAIGMAVMGSGAWVLTRFVRRYPAA